MIGTIEFGLIYGVMALGVFLTFRVLNFPDLTVDGSFTTGAAVAAAMIAGGQNPAAATLAGAAAGLVAGAVTGLLHTKGRIDGLLAGILTMIALWSINLRIMGKSNIQLIREQTVFTPLDEAGLLGTWAGVLIFFVAVFLLKLAVDWFLSTDLGFAIQATGNNGPMVSALGANTDRMKILTLSLSNGFVALSGALLAQYQGFADISMGVGLILIGLAAVILGQAVFGGKNLWIGTLAAVVGAVLYRLIIFWALAAGLNPNDQKLITAALVVAALLLSHFGVFSRIPSFGGKTRAGGKRAPAPPEAPPVAAATPRQEG